MKKVVVTGASGFVGSFLVHELVSHGYKVFAIGRKSLDNLSDYRKSLLSGSTYQSGNITDIDELKLALDNFLDDTNQTLDFFIHLAWYGKSRLSDLDLEAQFSNVSASIDLYKLASHYRCSRFIYCGSMEEAFAEAYTKLEYKNENKSNRHVIYAMAKLAARSALKLSWNEDMPDLIFLTNSHVIGIEDDKDSFLQVATAKLMNGETLNTSSGSQIFDVIHVSDCARAYRLAAEHGLPNASYWAGSGQARPLRDYVKVISNMYPDSHVNYGAMPFDDVVLPLSLFSIESLAKDTGYKALVSFDESIQELAKSLQS